MPTCRSCGQPLKRGELGICDNCHDDIRNETVHHGVRTVRKR